MILTGLPTELLVRIARYVIDSSSQTIETNQHTRTQLNIGFTRANRLLRSAVLEAIVKKKIFVEFTFVLVQHRGRYEARNRLSRLLEQFYNHRLILDAVCMVPGATVSVLRVELADDGVRYPEPTILSKVFIADVNTLQLMFACIVKQRLCMTHLDVSANVASIGLARRMRRFLQQMAIQVRGVHSLLFRALGPIQYRLRDTPNRIRTNRMRSLQSNMDDLSLFESYILTFKLLLSSGRPSHHLLSTAMTLCDTLMMTARNMRRVDTADMPELNSANVSCLILIFTAMSEQMLRRPNTLSAQGHWCKVEPYNSPQKPFPLRRLLYHLVLQWKTIRSNPRLHDEPDIWCAVLQARTQLYLAFARSAKLHPITRDVCCGYLTNLFDTTGTAEEWMRLARRDVSYIKSNFQTSTNLSQRTNLENWLKQVEALCEEISDIIFADLLDPLFTERSPSTLIQIEHRPTRLSIFHRGQTLDWTMNDAWMEAIKSSR